MTGKEVEKEIKAALDVLSELIKSTDFEITGTVKSKRLGEFTYRIGHKPEGGK